jgi:NFACT protein RNA binding domain
MFHLVLASSYFQGKTWDDLTPDAIRDASQWCKQGSIEGCKLPSCVIIYTPWSNLRKDGSMAAGQVSFHNDKLVRKYVVTEKDKDTLRRLEKSREERVPDFAAERKQRDDEERARLKAEYRERSKAEKELQEQRKKEKEERSYDRLFKKDAGGTSGGKGKGGAKAGAGGSGLEDDFADMGLGVKPTEDASAAVSFEEGFM